MSTNTLLIAAQPANRQAPFLPRGPGMGPVLRSIDVERLNAFARHRLLRSHAPGPAPHAFASASAEEDGDWVLVAPADAAAR